MILSCFTTPNFLHSVIQNVFLLILLNSKLFSKNYPLEIKNIIGLPEISFDKAASWDGPRPVRFFPNFATIYHELRHSTYCMHFRFLKSNLVSIRTCLIQNSLILAGPPDPTATCAWSVIDRKLISIFYFLQ